MSDRLSRTLAWFVVGVGVFLLPYQIGGPIAIGAIAWLVVAK